MYRVMWFTLGVLMASWGLVFNIIYLALFDLGYSFNDYWNYLVSRSEVYLLPLGFMIVLFALIWPFAKK